MEVFLGSKKLNIVSLSPTRTKVSIPKGANSGRFKLVTYSRQVVSRLPFKVDEPRPALTFRFAPTVARRGSEVTLFLDPPRQGVSVFYNGRPMPKRVFEGGKRIVVTVPADARSGYFELEYDSERFRAKKRLRVR
jgi:hypothetical protein